MDNNNDRSTNDNKTGKDTHTGASQTSGDDKQRVALAALQQRRAELAQAKAQMAQLKQDLANLSVVRQNYLQYFSNISF